MKAAQQRVQDNQNKEYHISRQAMEAALSQIDEGEQRLTRRISSHTETVQEGKRRAEEAWLEFETTYSAQKKAERLASQRVQRRQTMDGENRSMVSVAPGKARNTMQEACGQSTAQCTTTAPADSGSFEGRTRENVPEPPSYERPSTGSNERPYCPKENIQARSGGQRLPGQDAAEERRRLRKARELNVRQVTARDDEREQRRAMDLRDGLAVAERRIQINTETPETRSTTFQTGVAASVEPLNSESVPTQARPPSESSESSKSHSQKGTGLYTSNDISSIRGRCDGTSMNVDDAQQPGSGADRSQTDHIKLLEQLLEHSRASDENTARLASELSELRRAVVSAVGRQGGAAPTADQDESAPRELSDPRSGFLFLSHVRKMNSIITSRRRK
ncbi:hypothetical protein EDB85DRAFT_417588 [Lactarius pseudohatsudake]|nr:hypothetical protein EDB85DRAFT_417588 [Lactarius pseudohatsudake]